MDNIESSMTISSAAVPLATTTIYDLPDDAIRIIFGHSRAMNSLEFQTGQTSNISRFDSTILTVIGRHVCTRFRDVLACESRFRYVGELAAAVNQFKLVKWAISYGYYPDDGAAICAWAAGHNNDDMLNWAKSRGYSINATSAASAALGGHLDMFKKIINYRVKIDENVITKAIMGGCIPILEYILLRNPTVEWDHHVVECAPVEAILWATKNMQCDNLHSTADLVILSITYNRVDIIECIVAETGTWLFPEAMALIKHVAQYGTPEMVDYLISAQTLITSDLFQHALAIGRVVVYRHIYSRWGAELPAIIPMKFIETCNTPAIIFLRENGSEWPENALRTIVAKDVHDAIKYAAIPATATIAWQTNKDLIELMVERNCPRTPGLPRLYADAGMHDAAEWLRGLGCPE